MCPSIFSVAFQSRHHILVRENAPCKRNTLNRAPRIQKAYGDDIKRRGYESKCSGDCGERTRARLASVNGFLANDIKRSGLPRFRSSSPPPLSPPRTIYTRVLDASSTLNNKDEIARLRIPETNWNIKFAKSLLFRNPSSPGGDK